MQKQTSFELLEVENILLAKKQVEFCRDKYFQLYAFLKSQCHQTPKVKRACETLVEAHHLFELAKSDMATMVPEFKAVDFDETVFEWRVGDVLTLGNDMNVVVMGKTGERVMVSEIGAVHWIAMDAKDLRSSIKKEGSK